MKRARFALSACLSSLLLLTVPAGAVDTCEPFSMLYDFDEISVVDNPPSGESVGDIRNARSRLLDEQGNEVGVIYYTATAMPRSQDAADDLLPLLFHGNVILPAGTIAATGVFGRNIGSRNVLTENLSYAVVGGTGAFTHASGEITATLDADSGKRRFTFNIKCQN